MVVESMTEPRDDARSELYEALGAAMLAAGLHPNEAQTLAITDAIRPAPVTQCEAEPDWDANLPTAEDVRGIIPRCDAVNATLRQALEIARPYVERAYWKTSGDECSAKILEKELAQIDAALVPPSSEAGREVLDLPRSGDSGESRNQRGSPTAERSALSGG